MTRYFHEAVFQCPADNCGCCWVEDRTDNVAFPYYDATGMKAVTEECPECKTEEVWGEILSTEDLDFDANRSAAIAEGRSDQENGR